MKYKKLISFLAFFLAVLSVYGQNPFVLKSGEPVTVACGNSEEEVVHTALNLLNRDVETAHSDKKPVVEKSLSLQASHLPTTPMEKRLSTVKVP